MKKRIWVDNKKIKIGLKIISFMTLVIIGGVIFTSDKMGIKIFIIGSLLIILYYSYQSRKKLIWISNEGIYVGCGEQYLDFGFGPGFRCNPGFITFNNISHIKIERQRMFNFIPTKFDILVVKTKDNKKYEGGIDDQKGFVNTLKQLKKSNLLSKDLKYE